jgi:hypothetical protein
MVASMVAAASKRVARALVCSWCSSSKSPVWGGGVERGQAEQHARVIGRLRPVAMRSKTASSSMRAVVERRNHPDATGHNERGSAPRFRW